MGRRTSNINMWQAIDKPSLIIYIVFVIWGWISIYSASYDYGNSAVFDFSSRAGKQLIWIGCAVVLIFFIMLADRRIFEIYTYPLYAFVLFVLALTIFIAPNIKGSHSWLVMGPVSIQPAEFAKIAVALCLARFMNSYNFVLLKAENFIKTALIVFIPMVLIILQKEMGSALIYTSLLLVFYREGMSGFVLFSLLIFVIYFVLALKYSYLFWGITPAGETLVLILILIILVIMTVNSYKKRSTLRDMFILTLSIVVIGAIVNMFTSVNWAYILYFAIAANSAYIIYLYFKSWSSKLLNAILVAVVSIIFLFSVNYIYKKVLEPHQQARISVAFGMEEDPRGIGYNVNQSKIAIGSGGFLGKGLFGGTQTKLKYVPEQDTDFIYCTVGEETGFVGASTVVVLFIILIWRIIFIAERQPDVFGRVYGYSVAAIFFFNFAINVGMVLGLSPVIGIPLPLFSYGGSSLWSSTILLFILLRLDVGRKEYYR